MQESVNPNPNPQETGQVNEDLLSNSTREARDYNPQIEKCLLASTTSATPSYFTLNASDISIPEFDLKVHTLFAPVQICNTKY